MRNKKLYSLLIVGLFLSIESCAVIVHEKRTASSAPKKDNGNHNGWNKNANNPHHPNSTNPGKGNKKK